MKNTRNPGRSLATLGIAASLLLVPASAFAKTNSGKGNSNSGKDNSVSLSLNGCPTKAFGHLFAPGWLKRNDATTLTAGCILPPGIAKKLGIPVPAGTSTDTTAPIISSIIATPGTTTASVAWNTNELADSAVFFSTSLPVNTNATGSQMVSSDAKVFGHNLTLNNLSASTTYFVVIRSRDASGNAAMSSTFSFTTGVATDNVSPIITNLIVFNGTSTLRFTWNTNEPATSKIFYSTTTPVNVNSTSTPFVENTALVTSHDITITGLATSTVYRIVVQSKDAANNIGTVNEVPVTTSQ